MKALVTGHAGFVGQHLTAHLAAHGWDVTGFDIQAGGDIRDYEQIRATIDAHDPDAIWHLAAQAHVGEGTTDPRRAFDVNLGGTLNLLEAVRHTGSRPKIMLAGTSEEYGYDTQAGDVIDEDSPCRPTTPYGVSKLAATQLGMVYARIYGLRVVATRAWNHTGPGHPARYAVPSFARQIAQIERGEREVLRHGNLEARRSYLDVRDVVEAYRLVVDCEPGIYNVGTPRVTTMSEVLQLLIGMSQRAIATEPDPSLYRPGWTSGSERFPEPSSAKLHATTGWKPAIPLEQTLADVLDHWRNQP